MAGCLDKIDVLAEAVNTLRSSFSGTIIVSLPPFPTTSSAAPVGLTQPIGVGALHRQVTELTMQLLAQAPGLHFWDLEAVQRVVGLTAAVDFRQWYLYRQPFSEQFLLSAATSLARMIAAPRRAPKKCVVVDGDNTLWGGIVGEDGVGGVALGHDFPGSAYLDFQRLLLHWRSQGVILALASKNNEADVIELFERRTEMVLKRSDFAAWRVNWETKPDNLVSLAAELNLGLDSFVFIDDNPIEVEYIRQTLPAVLCVLLPEEPAEILPQMRELACFDRFEVTAEDRARTEMIQAEAQRRSLGSSLSKEEFLRALELKVNFFTPAAADLDRVAQLINKTNQFNLTTRRRTLDQVREIAASADYKLYGVQVADRFGAYGLTGVVVIEAPSTDRVWTIDTFLLSCRVLGRGVETALLSGLAKQATEAGVKEISANFVPSSKNAPAASFLADHGFRQDSIGTWRISVATIPVVKPWIVLEEERGR
jgi:FkbH-like protein